MSIVVDGGYEVVMNKVTEKTVRVYAIGLMSGTSADGIDVALIRTDGQFYIEPVAHYYMPYTQSQQLELLSPVDNLMNLLEREHWLTLLHRDAIYQLLKNSKISASLISVVGFHGHTLYHAPAQGLTYQMGNAALLASQLGIDVVADFRRQDVAHGGQGAPLVPLYHQAKVGDLNVPVAVVNIGGVANVTYVGRNGAIAAWDTGPGNHLMNDYMRCASLGLYDEGGRLAAKGVVQESLLKNWLGHSYWQQKGPKSIDRSTFSYVMNDVRQYSYNHEDIMATLTALTSITIARSLPESCADVLQWIVVGGGRHNQTLLSFLAKELPVPVVVAEALGWNGDMIEAEAFAYLAVRRLYELPLSDHRTTGIVGQYTGGGLWRGRSLEDG
jgi:anhydro-N-acetylmuramic acid kinase